MRVGEQKGPEIASQRDDFLGREGGVMLRGGSLTLHSAFPPLST